MRPEFDHLAILGSYNFHGDCHYLFAEQLEVTHMNLIITLALLALFAEVLLCFCRKTKKEPAAMEERKASPCDHCPFWSECRGEDKSNCLMYKAEDEIYG